MVEQGAGAILIAGSVVGICGNCGHPLRRISAHDPMAQSGRKAAHRFDQVVEWVECGRDDTDRRCASGRRCRTRSWSHRVRLLKAGGDASIHPAPGVEGP
jgi:hypothetical protein